MLHPFVSVPNASRTLFAPVLVLSASVHVGLLCGALASTRDPRLRHEAKVVAEQVRFVALPFRAVRRTVPRSSDRGQRARPADPERELTLPRLPQLPASFDLLLPELAALPDYQPDYDAKLEFGGGGVLTDDVLNLGVGLAAPRLPVGALYDAFEELAVEKRVVPVPANRKPRYPSRMLDRRIETNFNVTFVVDTSGIVDRETVELPRSIEQEFASAVVEVLYNWRFLPAELGGRRVRQRVLQPFIFQLSFAGRP
jgi:protein TonB